MADDRLILRSRYLQWLLGQIFPKLRKWPIPEWPNILGKAKEIEFDQFERIGTMAGVILVAMLVKPAPSFDTTAVAVFLGQFLFLGPLLTLALGPFFVRRIRRGITLQANERSDSENAK